MNTVTSDIMSRCSVSHKAVLFQLVVSRDRCSIQTSPAMGVGLSQVVHGSWGGTGQVTHDLAGARSVGLWVHGPVESNQQFMVDRTGQQFIFRPSSFQKQNDRHL